VGEMEDDAYVLGHSDEEHDRLILQSRLIGPLSEAFFVKAGLAPGMDVLDIGCGAGDLSLLAAGFVGREGTVLGVDRSKDSLALARRRVEAAGLGNVRFEPADLDHFNPVQTFDALVGRFVVLFLKHPVATLARLSARVRPGGLVVLQEWDIAGHPPHPDVPLYEDCSRWAREAFARAGIDGRFGARLHRLFTDAGLPRPEMQGAVRVESGPDSDIYEYTAQSMRSLLPLIEKTGVATAAEVGVETLADRLRAQTVAANASLTASTLVGAWVRV